MREYLTKRTALIDADFIAYQLAAWAHGNQADSLEMTERIEEMFTDWMARSCCTFNIACFSCDREDNYRKDHYPLYKSHRTGEPPAMLDLAKRIVSQCAMKTVRIPRLEADDIMGILATAGKIGHPVIVTVDKDLRGVPGWHFNPTKEDFPVQVTETEADYVFHTQWLTGDSTDGFGGIKGCGPAKAKKLLNVGDDREWTDVVLEAYGAAGYTDEECLAQARCARILRACDFDASTRTAIPWTPPAVEV